MWKKALPLTVVAGVLLVGCNNNNALPKNNETPMENIREDAREWKNDVERDIEGRNFNDGNVNEYRDTTGANNAVDDGINPNPRVEIIEDVNRRNGVE